ncbi:MAG TPA: 3D domain-containing protein [Gammaproteobacteria bacterium]|nr:3D domain-containing protein [Gammaproteobacteria bacterium]
MVGRLSGVLGIGLPGLLLHDDNPFSKFCKWWLGTCHGGQGFYGTLQCPPGYKLVGNTCVGDKELAVNPDSPVIPYGSHVLNDHVLTKSDLALTLTEGDQPDASDSVALQSDRGSVDQIVQPGLTDSNGNAQASVSTRDQSGSSTITSATADIKTKTPGIINWLPAKYENTFEVTCYGVAQESTDIRGPMVIIPGISGTHHKYFFWDTQFQGTGLLLDGNYIQRNWHKKGYYEVHPCPETSSGTCATKGITIAVDTSIIPMWSTVSIDPVGDRIAEDGGGWIHGYHIDVFFGRTASDYKACLNFGKSFGHTATFISYGN